MSAHPTEINMHQKSRTLEISFDTGETFNLPAEYLRVHSPSAEVQGHAPGQGKLQVGKEDVNIENITPVGSYGVQLHFDDNHNTGIYSWDTLYDLGRNYDQYWQEYLQRLEEVGHKRRDPSQII